MIGGFLLSWLIKRWGPFVVLMATYAAAAAALLLLSSSVASPLPLILSLLVIGIGVGGGQAALNALSARSLSHPRPRDGRWWSARHGSRGQFPRLSSAAHSSAPMPVHSGSSYSRSCSPRAALAA